MPKIEIVEQDLTSPGTFSENTDVAYIPGFVDVANNFDAADYDQVLPINTPTLFTSVASFEAKCGKQPAKFATTQYYKDIGGMNKGFDDVAVPYNGIMFAQGDVDPAYVMAKELLSMGLNVLYERVNPDVFTKTTDPAASQPADWDDIKDTCDKQVPSYETVMSARMPEMTTIANGLKYEDTNTYYTRMVITDEDTNEDIVYYRKAVNESGTEGKIPTEDIDKDTGLIKSTSNATNTYYIKGNTSYYLKSAVATGTKYEPGKYYRLSTPSSLEYDVVNDPTTTEVNITYTVTDEDVTAHSFTLSTIPVIEIKSLTISDKSYTVASSPVKDTSVSLDKKTGVITFASDDTNFKVSANVLVDYTAESQPANWPAGCYVFTENNLIEKDIIVDTVSMSVLTFDKDWIDGWDTNGIFKTSTWVPNNGAAFEANVSYRIVESAINIKTMYDVLDGIFDAGSDSGVMDKGNYSFKYMTTGGYPVYEYNQGALVQKMLNVAYTRGDCVAIIDYTDNIKREQEDIDHSDSLYATVKNDSSWKAHGEFATMFTPWATYNRLTTDRDYITGQTVKSSSSIRMPASFAYLLALADSIKTNANWLAIAGSARGAVLHLAEGGMTTIIPNGAADRMQPRDSIAINPITNINPYGNIIWGNRTLKDNAEKSGLTATSFLNIRNLVSDVKKQCYRTARQLTFEQNNDILWINFKALMSPLLDRMLSGYGISGYKMVIDTENEHYNEKATLCVKIILFPVYAVEDFYITIVLKDEDISVEEA